MAKQTNNAQKFQSHLIRFVNHQKTRIENQEITEDTLRNYFKAIKLFCEMNDINHISWKKITRGLPPQVSSSDDRIATEDEIKKLLDFPDRRIKPIVLTMISSGIRIGSWDHLKWKHVIPIKNENNDDDEVIAAKIISSIRR